MSADGQGTKRRRKITENYNCLSRWHERYRRQTDGRATAYSEREREFTFGKKWAESDVVSGFSSSRLLPANLCAYSIWFPWSYCWVTGMVACSFWFRCYRTFRRTVGYHL